MIKRLVIKDCLGIEELAINPGKVNVISGGNEKGKTSILETIEKALFNTKRRSRFVRTGAEKAYIELDTDNGISIKRTVAEDAAGLDTGSVKVTKDGHPVKAPETFLKELFGVTSKKDQDIFAFNPVDFMQKKDTEQTDILLGLLPIKVTSDNAIAWFGEAPRVNYEKHGLQVLKDLEQWFYDSRKEANARTKAVRDECEAVAKRLPDNYRLEDWVSINLSSLFADVSAAEEGNRKIKENQDFITSYDKAQRDIINKYSVEDNKVVEAEEAEQQDVVNDIASQKNDIENQIVTVDSQISELQNQIRDLEEKKRILKEAIKNLDAVNLTERRAAITKVSKERLKAIDDKRKADLEALDKQKEEAQFYLETYTLTDIAPLKAKCAEVEHMKSFIPLAKEVEALNKRLEEEEAKAEHYDRCVTAARKKPHELLATVELPVKGLGIDGRGIVTINDLPLSNLSTAQQVQTCLEIARALAKNTLLKLICIDKIEHLDETVRQEFLKQIEEDEGWQYFITQVTDGDLKIEVK